MRLDRSQDCSVKRMLWAMSLFTVAVDPAPIEIAASNKG